MDDPGEKRAGSLLINNGLTQFCCSCFPWDTSCLKTEQAWFSCCPYVGANCLHSFVGIVPTQITSGKITTNSAGRGSKHEIGSPQGSHTGNKKKNANL